MKWFWDCIESTRKLAFCIWRDINLPTQDEGAAEKQQCFITAALCSASCFCSQSFTTCTHTQDRFQKSEVLCCFELRPPHRLCTQCSSPSKLSTQTVRINEFANHSTVAWSCNSQDKLFAFVLSLALCMPLCHRHFLMLIDHLRVWESRHFLQYHALNTALCCDW